MKIVGSQIQQMIGTYEKRAARAGETGPVAGPADAVSLSTRGEEILKARQAYDALPEVREDRVAQIRQRLTDGTYTLDNEQIARAIADGARE